MIGDVVTETSVQRETLATSLLSIGKETLKAAQAGKDKTKFQYAIKWVQKAFAVVEHCEDAGETGLGDLKVAYSWVMCAYRQL